MAWHWDTRLGWVGTAPLLYLHPSKFSAISISQTAEKAKVGRGDPATQGLRSEKRGGGGGRALRIRGFWGQATHMPR